MLLNLFTTWSWQTTTYTSSGRNSFSGSKGDAGTGQVWVENKWAKAEKSATRQTSTSRGMAAPTAWARASTRAVSLVTKAGDAMSMASSVAEESVNVISESPGQASANSSAHLFHSASIVSRYNGKCETLSMDEVIALLGMAA